MRKYVTVQCQAKGELLVTLLMPDLGLSRLLPVWPLVFFPCGLNTFLCSQLRKDQSPPPSQIMVPRRRLLSGHADL